MRDFLRGPLADNPRMLARAGNAMEQAFYGHRDRLADKWHHYLEVYDRHLSRYRGKAVHLLEIGVFKGGSLQIWKSYLGGGAVIHGIDIDPSCRDHAEPQIAVHIGHQADRRFLRQVAAAMGRVDVVVDDGSHTNSDQIATFEALYPLLTPDGVYICEDTHTSYWPEYGGGYRKPGTFVEFAKGLVDRLHAWHVDEGEEASARDQSFARTTNGIAFYDSMVVLERRWRAEPLRAKVGWRQD
jgi:cephalosporin hydroxylase